MAGKKKKKKKCIYCGGALVKAGRKPSGTGRSWYQKYKCKKCGKTSTKFKV